VEYLANGPSLTARTSIIPAPRNREHHVGRAMDIVLSAAGIVVLAPLMLLIALAIMLTDPGPIFFAQRRIGRGGKLFPCFKFRTMVPDAESRLAQVLATDPNAAEEWMRDRKLRRDPRITRVGKFLRQSSFDELPQLFNVFRGDMGIVGPRPIVTAEQVFYGRAFTNYCSVRPGITGLWQISGRNDVSYRRRVALDVVYARNKSLRWDLRIIILTVPAVIFANGSY
jgi:exopolysaccharide production protein ExoY